MAGPGGPAGPATASRFVYSVPANYTLRHYGQYDYYWWDGAYYYPYSNGGPTIYVEAPVVNGAPTVPPRPYIYTLPADATLKNFNGTSFWDYYGYYYYLYYINGQPVYTLARVVNGVPTVPQPPY